MFTIEPASGDIWPNTEAYVSIDFHPQAAEDYERTAFCEVTGRETRLPLKMIGKGKGPNVTFAFSDLDIGEIFINSVHEYEVLYLSILMMVDKTGKPWLH